VEYASTSAEAIAAIIDTADAVPRDGTGGGSEIPPGGAAGESVADGIDDDPGGETASADGLSSTGVGADASASGSGATAPPPELALKSVRPSPSRGVVAAEFALPDGSAARLELIDIAGRRIAQREVGSLGPGWHSVELHRGLAAGVYMVRLTQGGSARTTKVAVIR
jgi:hypothetical protein